MKARVNNIKENKIDPIPPEKMNEVKMKKNWKFLKRQKNMYLKSK